MNELRPYTIQKIQDIQKELVKNTPQQTKQITVQYKETVQQPYTDTEQYQETYDDIESYYVQKIREVIKKEKRPESYTVNEYRVVGDQWKCKWLGTKAPRYGYVSVSKVREIEVDVQVSETQTENVTETKQRPVQRTRTATRQVTKYRPIEETRTKIETVPIPHDEKVFYEIVKEERIKEIRLSFQQAIAAN